MADIKVRGYTLKGSEKESKAGKKYNVFTLKEGIKQGDGSYKNAFYNVTYFGDELPLDGSKVQLSGFLKPREYELNGVKRTSLDMVAQEMEVLEVGKPRDGAKQAEDEFADF